MSNGTGLGATSAHAAEYTPHGDLARHRPHEILDNDKYTRLDWTKVQLKANIRDLFGPNFLAPIGAPLSSALLMSEAPPRRSRSQRPTRSPLSADLAIVPLADHPDHPGFQARVQRSSDDELCSYR
ncbi:hypothetical protein B0H14DRAFT_2579586 [Mycena olivaceomarginata]|nr:hypothetical protein B0H14DRAFT_2579586 [Mycena olivaceomarginata]